LRGGYPVSYTEAGRNALKEQKTQATEVGQPKLDGEALPEDGDEVAEVQRDTVNGGLFQRAAVDVKVAVAEFPQRDCVAGQRRILRGLSIELEERYNAHSGGHLEKSLAESHEHVIGLIDLGFGLRAANVSEGEIVAFSLTHELAVEAVTLLHDGGHGFCSFAISLQ